MFPDRYFLQGMYPFFASIPTKDKGHTWKQRASEWSKRKQIKKLFN